MRLHKISILLVSVGLLAASALGQADKDLVALAKTSANSVVIVRCVFKSDAATNSTAGQAVCISEDGTFLSLGFGSGMHKDEVEKCEIFIPGQVKKTLQASLLHIDRETGLAFVKCTDPNAPKWTPVKPADSGGPTVGQKVLSVGLMPGDPANSFYFGIAYVSAVLELPDPLVHVTGGTLTKPGSMVFSTDGRLVGLTMRQLTQPFEMIAQKNKPVSVGLRSSWESQFFTPIGEYMHVIKAGVKGRELAWTGIGQFLPVDTSVNNLDHPAVKIAKVITGQPAERAGLTDLDMIVKVNGQYLPDLGSPSLATLLLRRMLTRMNVGDKVTFTLADTRNMEITLAKMPLRPSEARRYYSKKVGMIVREKVGLDEYLSSDQALKASGLLVVAIEKNSPAHMGKLQTGDVITTVSAQPVRSIATLKLLLEKATSNGSSSMDVTVQRGSTSIPIRLPLRR